MVAYLPPLVTSANLALIHFFGWQAVVLIIRVKQQKRSVNWSCV